MAPVVAKLQAGTQTSMDADQSSNSASMNYSSEVPVGSLDAFDEELPYLQVLSLNSRLYF